MSLSVTNRTTQQKPRLPFEDVARTILPSRFDLSLVFVGDAYARRLNKTYRGKTYYPNILSFPLSKDSGEIFINLSLAKREAKNYDLPPSHFILLLFIHGCLHLSGKRHGVNMERTERRLLSRFVR